MQESPALPSHIPSADIAHSEHSVAMPADLDVRMISEDEDRTPPPNRKVTKFRDLDLDDSEDERKRIEKREGKWWANVLAEDFEDYPRSLIAATTLAAELTQVDMDTTSDEDMP